MFCTFISAPIGELKRIKIFEKVMITIQQAKISGSVDVIVYLVTCISLEGTYRLCCSFDIPQCSLECIILNFKSLVHTVSIGYCWVDKNSTCSVTRIKKQILETAKVKVDIPIGRAVWNHIICIVRLFRQQCLNIQI